MRLLGIDIAKNVFHPHGVDALGKVVLKKRLLRDQLTLFIFNLPQCCIVMEACCGANYWSRVYHFKTLSIQFPIFESRFHYRFIDTMVSIRERSSYFDQYQVSQSS